MERLDPWDPSKKMIADDDRAYSVVLGGVVPPQGGKEGYLAILAKENMIRPDEQNLWLLDEMSLPDWPTLLDVMSRTHSFYQVSKHCLRRDEGTNAHIDRFNLTKHHRQPMIIRGEDPYTKNGELQYHLELLKELLHKGQRRLSFYYDSDAMMALSHLSVDISNVIDYDWPTIGALCYAVTGILSYGGASSGPSLGSGRNVRKAFWDSVLKRR
jgi:hypothetical protein